jgi:hypothetical protein
MSRLQRRYEVLLPLRFNDGQAVPDDLIAETLLELEQRFGAISSETQVIHGIWDNEGRTYRDELVRVFVDVADTDVNRRFFVRHKKVLEEEISATRHTHDHIPGRRNLKPWISIAIAACCVGFDLPGRARYDGVDLQMANRHGGSDRIVASQPRALLPRSWRCSGGL